MPPGRTTDRAGQPADENFPNGLSPTRPKKSRQRPNTASVEGWRVVGVPVLAGVEDALLWRRRRAFPGLGARRL